MIASPARLSNETNILVWLTEYNLFRTPSTKLCLMPYWASHPTALLLSRMKLCIRPKCPIRHLVKAKLPSVICTLVSTQVRCLMLRHNEVLCYGTRTRLVFLSPTIGNGVQAEWTSVNSLQKFLGTTLPVCQKTSSWTHKGRKKDPFHKQKLDFKWARIYPGCCFNVFRWNKDSLRHDWHNDGQVFPSAPRKLHQIPPVCPGSWGMVVPQT